MEALLLATPPSFGLCMTREVGWSHIRMINIDQKREIARMELLRHASGDGRTGVGQAACAILPQKRAGVLQASRPANAQHD